MTESTAAHLYQMSVPEMYQSVVINKGGFGMDDYQLPSTQLYLTRNHKFPTSPRRDIQHEARKRAKEPAPTAYSEDPQTTYKRLWQRSQGKFLYGQRNTVIDQVMKSSKTLPGPGSYFKTKKGEKPATKGLALGKFE